MLLSDGVAVVVAVVLVVVFNRGCLLLSFSCGLLLLPRGDVRAAAEHGTVVFIRCAHPLGYRRSLLAESSCFLLTQLLLLILHIDLFAQDTSVVSKFSSGDDPLKGALTQLRESSVASLAPPTGQL